MFACKGSPGSTPQVGFTIPQLSNMGAGMCWWVAGRPALRTEKNRCSFAFGRLTAQADLVTCGVFSPHRQFPASP